MLTAAGVPLVLGSLSLLAMSMAASSQSGNSADGASSHSNVSAQQEAMAYQWSSL